MQIHVFKNEKMWLATGPALPFPQGMLQTQAEATW